MIDLAIVIVSYNTRDLLRNCLTSVPAGCGDLAVEILVVDNASADQSADMVERDFPHVRTIRNDDNRGFAHANNVALAHATGRYVLLLNSDTVVRPGALAAVVAFMDAHPKCGYCGPRLVNGDGSHQGSARRFPTPLSGAYAMLGWAASRPASRHVLDLHAHRGDREAFPAGWLCGACLFARAEAVRDAGLLDDGFFLYFEETDWCKRMADAGWEGWYAPVADVVHLGGQSVVHDSAVRPFAGNHAAHWVASSKRYLRRHCGWWGMWFSILLQIKLYALIWLRHAWRGNDVSRQKAATARAAIGHLWSARCAAKPKTSQGGAVAPATQREGAHG